ncbi:Protein takeout [Eumeta japonica]|uniref:Protein takeout n=1 Tax=Eumeta variegata TaxID=151549 RepID=A0A4C1VXI5_EUMVA|nr:Protein takeout [Eumeta japonica]
MKKQLQQLHFIQLNDFACQLESARKYSANFAKGVPSLGIPSMDPMHIDKIENENSGLKMRFSDVEVTGLKDSVVELIQLDLEKQTLKLIITVKILMRGDYMLSGRILVLPIQGQGKFTFDIRKLKSDITAELAKKTTDDGKEYWQITTYTYKIDAQSIKYDFKNLFNGNKQLYDSLSCSVTADAAHEFANSNFREITAELVHLHTITIYYYTPRRNPCRRRLHLKLTRQLITQAGVLKSNCLSSELYASYTDDIPTLRGHLEDWKDEVMLAL